MILSYNASLCVLVFSPWFQPHDVTFFGLLWLRPQTSTGALSLDPVRRFQSRRSTASAPLKPKSWIRSCKDEHSYTRSGSRCSYFSLQDQLYEVGSASLHRQIRSQIWAGQSLYVCAPRLPIPSSNIFFSVPGFDIEESVSAYLDITGSRRDYKQVFTA